MLIFLANTIFIETYVSDKLGWSSREVGMHPVNVSRECLSDALGRHLVKRKKIVPSAEI